MSYSAAPQLATGAVRATVNAFGLALVRGDYPADSLLPKEDELAARFAVGRSTLREAVKVLSGKGLVRTARRVGSRVCPRTEWNLLDPEVLGWHLADPAHVLAFLAELTEARGIIEPEAAALAARRATPAESARLIALAEMLETAQADGAMDTAMEIDVSFHVCLMEAAHNRLVGSFGRSLAVLLRAQFRMSLHYFPDGPARYHADEKHLLLARAVAGRRADEARRVSASMFRAIGKWVRSAVRQGAVHAALRPHLKAKRGKAP
jgi:DNA-binding FadR family transcriptional regulator